MSKKALGKGLDALLYSDKPAQEKGDQIPREQIIRVPVASCKPNPHQPRKTFNEETLSELTESVREQGIIQPILVERKDDSYVIIAGERRFRAAVRAGLEEIPVVVKQLSEAEKLEIALIENIQRDNLTPIEEAEGYSHLIEQTGLNQEEIARKVGKKRSTVANSLRLLKLPRKMQSAISAGEMSAGHARAILSILNPAHQDMLFDHIIDRGLSVREAENEAARLNSGKLNRNKEKGKAAAGSPETKPPEIGEMEERFIDALGTKVEIRGGIKKGKVELHYYSMDDLERLYEVITKKK